MLGFVAVVAGSASCQAGPVQGQTALPIRTLLTAPRLAPGMAPAASPNGEWVAYTVVQRGPHDGVQSGGVPPYGIGGDIWISRLADGFTRRVTHGGASHWGPGWSPTGRYLAFLSDRGDAGPRGSIHLWLWDSGTRQLRRATEAPVMDPWGRLGRLEWLADDRTVVVKMPTDARDDTPAQPDSGVTVELFGGDAPDGVDRAAPNDLSSLSGDLALVNVEDGSINPIVKGLQICSYALSPDRRLLAYAVATRYERPGSYQILVDIFVYDIRSRTTRRLVRAAPLVYAFPNYPVFAWSPDSRAVAYRTDGPAGTSDEVYVVRLDGTPVRVAGNRVLEEPLHAGRPLWDAAGRRVFFIRDGALWQTGSNGGGERRLAALPDRSLRMVEEGSGALWSPDRGRSSVLITGSNSTKRMGFARVDLETGEIVQLVQESKWYDTTRADPMVVTRGGDALLYVAESHQRPAELWLFQGVGQRRSRQITHIAPDLGKFTAAKARIIEWESVDGDTLRGALIVPAEHQAGTRLPTIVKLYGGTSLSDDLHRFGFAFDPVESLHLFTSRGYAVLLADSRLRVGTPMLDLLKTVMPGVDRAVALGIADPNRLVVTGHSYGGYSALALLVQTRRFRAAVVRAGIGDLLGAYGQLGPEGTNYTLTWAEQGQGRMGGTPWEVRPRYIENSPVFYLDRVTAPILLIHGGSDRNIQAFLADQVFSGLRRLGKRVEYARYRGEGHWEATWSLSNQIDYLQRVIRWLERHLRPAAPASVQ